ncbi:MAG TPA: phosphoserine phosphatase SerB [Candidatus Nanopelagicales bacterium]
MTSGERIPVPVPAGAGDPALATTFHATVVGVDRPGITARLFGALAQTQVVDVEQVVVAGQLVLGAVVLAAPGAGPALLAGIRAAVPDVDVAVRHVHATDVAGAPVTCTVTIVGRAITGQDVAALAGVIAADGSNITRIDRVADYPVTALALEVAAAEPDRLRRDLAARRALLGVDVAVRPHGLSRRGTHLVVMDVDSTLIQDEVIELLARFAGREAQVRAVTEAAMRGELDFAASLHARVAELAGLPATVIDEARAQVRLTPGARTLCRTLKRLGYRIALVSGGFTEVIAPIAEQLGVDAVRANGLEVVDGHLTGRVRGPVIDRAAKAAALREFAAEFGIPAARTVAIGDGANDLDMLAAADHGIAFNAKPVVQAAADTALNVPYLDTVLYLLGISREEVEQADALADAEALSPWA